MEEYDEIICFGNGIVRNVKSDKFECSLCEHGKKLVSWEKHITKPSHTGTRDKFDRIFDRFHRQVRCKLCGSICEWSDVRSHAESHSILPWYDPGDKYEKFLDNFILKCPAAQYYCCLCDKILYEWSAAYDHIDNLVHKNLRKESSPPYGFRNVYDAPPCSLISNGIFPINSSSVCCKICDDCVVESKDIKEHTKGIQHINNRRKIFNTLNENRDQVCLQVKDETHLNLLGPTDAKEINTEEKKKVETETSKGSDNYLITRVDATDYFCLVCKCKISGDLTVVDHKKGRRHVNALKIYGYEQIFQQENNFYCKCCACEIPNPEEVAVHVTKEKHLSFIKSMGKQELETSKNKVKAKLSTQISTKIADKTPTSYGNDKDSFGSSKEALYVFNLASRAGCLNTEKAVTGLGDGNIWPIGDNEYHCEVCGCSIFDIEQIDLHVKSEMHSRSLGRPDEEEIQMERKNKVETETTKQPDDDLIARTSECDISCSFCKCEFSDLLPFFDHIKGKQHLNIIKMYGYDDISKNGNDYYCKCCECTIPDMENVSLHVKDKKHHKFLLGATNRELETNEDEAEILKKEEANPKSIFGNFFSDYISRNDAGFSYCVICDVNLAKISDSNLLEHVNGKRHKASLETNGCNQIFLASHPYYYCKCCNGSISGLDNVFLHVVGRKHWEMLEAKKHSRVQSDKQDEGIREKKLDEQHNEISEKKSEKQDEEISKTKLDKKDEELSKTKLDKQDEELSKAKLEKQDEEISKKKSDKRDEEISEMKSEKQDEEISKKKLDKKDEGISKKKLEKQDEEISKKKLDKKAEGISKKKLDKQDEEISKKISDKKDDEISNKNPEKYATPKHQKEIPKSLDQNLLGDFVMRLNDTITFCVICKCTMNDDFSTTSHIKGRRHAACLKQHGCNQVLVTEDDNYYCKCCKCSVKGIINISVHVHEKRHLSFVEESAKKEEQTNIDTTAMEKEEEEIPKPIEQNLLADFVMRLSVTESYCVICKCEIIDELSVNSHIRRKRHAASIKLYGCNFLSLTEDNNYYCECRKRTVGGIKNIFEHLNGKRHLKFIDETNEKEEQISPKNVDTSATLRQKKEIPKLNQNMLRDFVTRLNFIDSYCVLCKCEINGDISTKSHIRGRRHAVSRSQYGCNRVSLTKGNNYYCKYCNCSIKGIENIFGHVNDIKHRSAVNELVDSEEEISKNNVDTSPSVSEEETLVKKVDQILFGKFVTQLNDIDFYCELCKCEIKGESGVKFHIKGKPHAAALKEPSCNRDSVSEDNVYYCKCCNCTIIGAQNISEHLNGKRHLKLIDETNEKEEQISRKIVDTTATKKQKKTKEETLKPGKEFKNSEFHSNQNSYLFRNGILKSKKHNKFYCLICKVYVLCDLNTHLKEPDHYKIRENFYVIFKNDYHKFSCNVCNTNVESIAIKDHYKSHWIVPWHESRHQIFFQNHTFKLGPNLFYCDLCKDNFADWRAAYLHLNNEKHRKVAAENSSRNELFSLDDSEVSYLKLINNSIVPNDKTTLKCKLCHDLVLTFDEIFQHIAELSHLENKSNCAKKFNGIATIGEGSLAEVFGLLRIKQLNSTENRNEKDIKVPRQNLMCEFNVEEGEMDISTDNISDEAESTKQSEGPSSQQNSSCPFVVRKNNANFTCKVCNTEICGISAVNNHVIGVYHSIALKQYGCDQITLTKDNKYFCKICESFIFEGEQIYNHIQKKRHLRTMDASRKAEAETSRKARDQMGITNDVFQGQNLSRDFIPHNNVIDANETKIAENSDKTKQPQFNDLLSSMAADLERMFQQSKPKKKRKTVEKPTRFIQTIPPQQNNDSQQKIKCYLCKVIVYGRADLHVHLASHYKEEFVRLKQNRGGNNSMVNGFGNDRAEENKEETKVAESELSAKDKNEENEENRENVETEELLENGRVFNATGNNGVAINGESNDNGISSLLKFTTNETESLNSESDDEEIQPAGLTQVTAKKEVVKSYRLSPLKVNMKKVIEALNFKKDEIYDMEDKLEEIEVGMKLCLVTDNENIYCLVCRQMIDNRLQNYYEHLNSLDHCKYLDEMENDHANFEDFQGQFSDFDLAYEYMEDVSEDVVRCFVCEEEIENSDNLLERHINNKSHEAKRKMMHDNARRNFEGVKSRMKCDWYSVQKYWCVPCEANFQSEVDFVKHLSGHKHASTIKKIENRDKRLIFDFCAPCALLWFGYRYTYAYHCDIATHKWLMRDGHYVSAGLSNFSRELLNAPEKYINETIKYFDSLSANERDKEKTLIRDLEKAVKLQFPRAKAFAFGSRISGSGSPDSDIDVFLDCGNMYDGKVSTEDQLLFFMINAHKCLSKDPEAWDLEELLTNCRSPIIKACHRATGLSCDISFENGLAVENTKLIKSFIDIFPPCREMIIFLKEWLTSCDLKGSQAISSYALYWFIIFYLQKESILPSIATLIAMKRKSHKVSGWEVGVSHDFSYNESESNFTTKELLTRFFKYYADFDFRFDVACPILGEVVKKRDFATPQKLPQEMQPYVVYINSSANSEPFRIDSVMCIQDPFDLQHNLTKAVSKVHLSRFRTCCSKSLDLLHSS